MHMFPGITLAWKLLQEGLKIWKTGAICPAWRHFYALNCLEFSKNMLGAGDRGSVGGGGGGRGALSL